jgi:type IV secretory pathway VirB10-like protein
VSRCRLIIAGLVFSVAASGCAKAQARSEPVMPELTPPPPPPRVIETYVDEPAPAAEPTPPDAVAKTPAERAAKPPVPRVETPPKPEPPRTEPERPAAAPPTPPTLTLKPAPGSESTTEASIRTHLSRAARDLGRVNYATLNQDGKTQYDTAKRFMQQAEDALRAGNLILAGKLADKAAIMATVLVR